MKKMYYQVDNSDVVFTLDSIEACIEIIKEESADVKQDDEIQPEWTITTTWMTEEEFNNLPDTY